MRRLRPLAFLLLLLPALASAQSIVSVVPNSATRGAAVDVQITGSQTLFLQDSEVTSLVWLSQGGSRIDADSVDVSSTTLLNAAFNIPGAAPLGLWDVNAQQVDSTVVTLVGGFTIVGGCSITDLAAGAQTPCNSEANTYTQAVVVTYESPPSTGNLVVNGQTFSLGTSPQTVTLTGLTANGAAVNVTASFSADSGCSRTENALFTAPASCAVSPCSISDLAAGAQTACNATSNTYTQVVVVTFANAPASGNLVVNGQTFLIGTSPQSVTLVGLNANGAAVNVTASFSADSGCSRTENALFTAPASCAVSPCSISDLAAGAQTACNATSNTYTQVVVVTFANPPTSGNLVVNGQTFAIGTSPRSVTLTGLNANGAVVNVTASFSADSGCSRTENALFTAPASCAASPCSISDLAAGAQTVCNATTNTYTQDVVVTFANPPTSGNLVVNGQTFPIGTSPRSVTLTGLNANGAPVNVTARFSADTGCQRTANALFTAPQSCGQGGVLDCSDAEPSKDELSATRRHRFKKVRIEDVEGSNGRDATITITQVTSDEPVGSTCPDAVIHSNGTVDLRAESDSTGNGRVYTILFTATDNTGASCSDSVFVCVPRASRHDGDDDDDDHRRPGNRPGNRTLGGDDDDDDDRGGDHDGDNDGHGHRPHCVRDAGQYDATVCTVGGAGQGQPSTRPIVTKATGGQVTIQLTTVGTGPVDVRIYDLRGRLVRRLAAEQMPAGAHALHWDGRDANGNETASGIYLVRAVMDGALHTSKTVWMR